VALEVIQEKVVTVALEEARVLAHLSMLKMDPVVAAPAAIVIGGVVLSTLVVDMVAGAWEY
jgi:hypothetical protein